MIKPAISFVETSRTEIVDRSANIHHRRIPAGEGLGIMRRAAVLALLVFLAGCSTTRIYQTSEPALREAIPIAAGKATLFKGAFDPSSRTYFLRGNFFGFFIVEFQVTWEPTSEPGSMRVTARELEFPWVTGYLVGFRDEKIEKDFHHQLMLVLGNGKG